MRILADSLRNQALALRTLVNERHGDVSPTEASGDNPYSRSQNVVSVSLV